MRSRSGLRLARGSALYTHHEASAGPL